MRYENGAEILHADWPVYPAGHGWCIALHSLAVFPANTRFRQIDEIDKCFLCVAVGAGSCLEPEGDLYDQRWFHVAVWHDDLLELRKRGLVSGVLTEYEAALAWYEQRKNAHVMKDGQSCRPDLPHPRREEFDENLPTILSIAPEGIAVTDTTSDILVSLTRPVRDLESAIRRRVEPLLSIPLYDTAVREAAIILEMRLCEITASALFGQSLIDKYYKLLCSRYRGRTSAFFKLLRSELRTIFKFMRNDFAHALRDIREGQCRILLDRTSSALQKMNDIELAECDEERR